MMRKIVAEVGCRSRVREQLNNALLDLSPDNTIVLLENIWILVQVVQQSLQPLHTQL